jgi:carbamate kinase
MIVLAVGGNSLIQDERHRSVPDQYAAGLATCRHIAELLKQGHRVVITHGNGPQVGFILRRSELARHELHPVPLDSCGADTQGAIGYHLQLAMYNCTRDWPRRVPAVTVVTQVLVDAADPTPRRRPSIGNRTAGTLSRTPVGGSAGSCRRRSRGKSWNWMPFAR